MPAILSQKDEEKLLDPSIGKVRYLIKHHKRNHP